MRKSIKYLILMLLVGGLIISYFAYRVIYKPNTAQEGDKFIYIASTDSFPQLRKQLIDSGILQDETSFDLLAKRMKLVDKFKAGKYRIHQDMSNLSLIRMIRSGRWEKEVIKLKAEMSRDSVMTYLSTHLEANKDQLKDAMKADWLMEEGFTEENAWCIYLPDHYHFNWATPAEEVVKRFFNEYKKYWNRKRLGNAYDLDLSAEEACILASIVDAEAVHIEEMPTIAGLYLNRIEKGMKLQSDPTVLFVVGREGRHRVLYRDLEKSDPYNTYKNLGLPPGPIMLPDKRAIEAVLNPQEHNYIYMCAKEDGSYYHYFTGSYNQHLRNRAKYQRRLNQQGTRR
ncbi:MAG: endolytic transglycosylase MltG [Bacteroidia bacterium]